MSETSEEKEQQRRVVAEIWHHLPAKMNKNDVDVLLSILFYAVDRGADEDSESDDDSSDGEIEFSDYFSFEHGDIELDSVGRITFLNISWYKQSGYNLPPIIERLHKLQHINLRNFQLLPIELGNLPLLKSIEFDGCDRALFESIPEGLLLSALKRVKIMNIRGSCRSWSAFWKMLPDTLEELHFFNPEGEEVDEILCALQKNDFGFRESLTKLRMFGCSLNEGHLERLLFDMLPRFANLHTLNVRGNNIESLRGIEERIKKVERISSSSSSSSSPPPPSQAVMTINKLRKMTLTSNPVAGKVSNNPCEKAAHDPKEVAALITILDAFDGIYYVGGESNRVGGESADLGHYPSGGVELKLTHYPADVEHLLRINHAGRKFVKEGEKEFAADSNNNKPVIKLALLPKILEKAHSKSAEIYDTYIWACDDNDFRLFWDDEEAKNRKKCATGLFHLVRHFCGLRLAENHRRRSCDNRETSASASASATALLTNGK